MITLILIIFARTFGTNCKTHASEVPYHTISLYITTQLKKLSTVDNTQ